MKNNFLEFKKGSYGYIQAQKKRRFLWTILLVALPVLAFIGGIITTGTERNLITVVAVVGCLPACRSLVGTIMMFMQKPMDSNIWEQIHGHEGDLQVIYECYLTTYEKSVFIDSFSICGGKIIGYSSRLSGSEQFVEDHVKNIMKQNGYKVEVKVFKDIRPYMERMDYLNQHRSEILENSQIQEDKRYPGMTKEEILRRILLAISL